MAQKLTILGIKLNPELAIPPMGTFSIRENLPGSPVTIVGVDVTMSVTGVLTTPIEILGLTQGKTYRIKCVLNCGTSYAKLFTIPILCPPVENLSVALITTNNNFTNLKVFFTHIAGYNGYIIDVYKYAVPGSTASVFVNSYNVIATIGETVLSDPALFEIGIDYFVRISRICKGNTSAPSDFVQYNLSQIVATSKFNPVVDPSNVYLSVDITAVATEDLNFTVYFKLLDDTTMGPYIVQVPAGLLTGENIYPLTPTEEAIGYDTGSSTISEAAPSQINQTIITF